MTQYLLLIYDNEAGWQSAAPDLMEQMMQGHQQFGEKNALAIKGGNALESISAATSVRKDASGNFSVTDGPFVETKEALGGYYLVEAANLDEALALAKQIPAPFGGVEVRPIHVFE